MASSKKLRVAHARITNVLGIKELEFAPGGFTEVRGTNGSGKTSTLEALRSVLKGGHDATLLRNGAEKGEIVLVLDDGTQIRKSITTEKTDVKILRDEKLLSRPAEAIRALHDALSVNPVEFLRAPEKSRVDVLLQVMPIKVDEARLHDIAGQGAVFGLPAKLEGVDRIEALKKAVFDDRTGINRAARDKEGTINQLRATLPEVVTDAPETDAGLLARLNEIDAARDKELQRISEKLAGFKSVSEDKVAALRAEIAEIEKKIQAEQIAFAEIKSKASASEADARTAHAQARAGVEQQVKAIEEAQKAQTRFEQTRETIARLVGEMDGLKADSQARTDALEALEAYKAELLSSLPIPGLEVIEGKLFRNGIPFDRLNTKQQVDIAVEIAKLRAGELGLICVDGLELIAPEHFDAFRDSAEQSGLQLIISRVADGPLEVRS